MSFKVAINGFGRIGRVVFRRILENPDAEVVAINDLAPVDTSYHLVRYDSVHGRLNREVSRDGNSLVLDGRKIPISSTTDPAEAAKNFEGADVVFECTGKIVGPEKLNQFLTGSIKKVLLSRPVKPGEEEVPMFVMGVNHGKYDGQNILSNASCTTNCLAPLAFVINKNFGIVKGLMTTIHSYTNDQNTLDQYHKDMRRARAANLSMIPTTTGAARAVGKVLPELNGKLDGFAIRVPTPNVSLVDLTVNLEKTVTAEQINSTVFEASQGDLKGILGYNTEPLVSSDFNGDTHSSHFEALLTSVLGKEGDNFVKVISWYDNETGYSQRMVDLARYVLTGEFKING